MQSALSTFGTTARILTAFLFLAGGGCPSPSAAPHRPAAPTKSQPLTLLVVDDPPLGQAIQREWRGRTEEDLVVRDVSLAELLRAARLPGDAVIFPSGFLGHLAERGLITPLDSNSLEDADFSYRDIFDLVRLREMRWGGRTMAASLGSPQLMLCYRADIFEKLGLEPPTDWNAYQVAVTKLADRANLGSLAPPDNHAWQAAIEPLADGWAGQMLLARAAGYAMHRDQVSPLFRFETMEPLIDRPPYVRALEELVAARAAVGKSVSRMTPAEAFGELLAGRCGITLTWPTAGASSAAVETPPQPIRFAPLPGGEAYRFATETWEMRSEIDATPIPLLAGSGRMAAVTASAADAQRATGFVLWLTGRDVSQQVGPLSAATTLFRNSQIATSDPWTPGLARESSRQYAETLAMVLSGPRAFPGVTLPGRLDYLAALDAAVYEALGGKPPTEALAGAAKEWRAITERLGVENQRRANSRSLGKQSGTP